MAPAIAATNDVVFVICLKAGSVLSVGACFPLLFECFRRIGKPYRWPQARVGSLARNQSREQHAGTTRSGGREPAVVGKPNAVRRKSPTIQRRCDGRTRAAGVSPLWSVNRTRCGENRPPFDDDATDEQERRALARRGVCKPASAIAMRRISAFRVRIECTPRGAYAPRSSVAVRMSADEKPIFAMYIRMPTRAAGVSPPWSVNRTQCGENRPPFDDDATDEQERRASARRVFGRSNDVRDFSQITCKCVPHITAGLRQPLLIAPRPFGAEYDIWDVQTHVHKSGGRQSAVRFGKRTCRVG